MTLRNQSGEGTLVRVQAEAAAWIALLHSDERNAEIEAGLKRWITADPLHSAAWEAATDIWNETSGLPRRIPLPQVMSHRATRAPYLRPLLAMAVVLFLVCGGFAAKYFLQPSVNTVVGEQRTLNLEDGTRVELNTDSHLVVKYDRRFRTVVLSSGEAYFQVAHESRPFVVIAGERRVLALGTAFTVRRDDSADNPLTVTLIEGRVAVEPVEITDAQAPPPKVEILGPGERLRVRRHAPPTLDSPSMDKVTGWMRGQLIFDHTPLREAIAEFNRYSAAKIAVASPRAGAIPVGGIFRISDSKSFARAVAETYNLHLSIHDGVIVLDGETLSQTAPDP